jgi:hypothetical protein
MLLQLSTKLTSCAQKLVLLLLAVVAALMML